MSDDIQKVEIKRIGHIKDLSNMKFGLLDVIKIVGRGRNKAILWLCRCNCELNKERIVESSRLIEGRIKSCGCTNKAKFHDGVNTPEYKSWTSLKERCNNPKYKKYKNYGGRGIKVCEKWNDSFENFRLDMGLKPSSSHTIDRIDNNGDYCKKNCRWATKKEQSNNTRTNHFIEYNGEKLTISEWARKLNINRATLSGRIRNGWSLEKAFSPTKKGIANE